MESSMACTEERSDRIAAFSAGRLDAEEMTEFLDHVEVCSECSEELDLAADLVATLKVARPALKRPLVRRLHLLTAAAAVIAFFGFARFLGDDSGEPVSLADLAQLAPLPSVPFVPRAVDTPEEVELFSTAMEAYAALDFTAAASLLAECSAAEPGDALTHLYLGIARLQLGELASAVESLEQAAELGGGLLRDNARWYLANAHLALEETGDARRILAALASEESEWELNARELLEAIEALPAFPALDK